MATTAVDWLHRHGQEPASGLVVSATPMPAPDERIQVAVGNHPEPGHDSWAAAEAVDNFVRGVDPSHTVLLLLSGGATSLMAGPVPGVSPVDLASLFALVGRAGFDIHAMNAVRKRFVRWGAGRLARDLAPSACLTFAMSDVPGDAPASIGSGPTCPDANTIQDVVLILDEAGLLPQLPPTVEANITGIRNGEIEETPKPDDPLFASAELTIIAGNADARTAAVLAARQLGWVVTTAAPLSGDAAEAGRAIGAMMVTPPPTSDETGRTRCVILGGETTVRLGLPHGRGGRCQELALAAAEELSGSGEVMALLAAGTDGRDGPTDAAGAIVDPGTWNQIRAAGRDPSADLANHCAYEALGAAGALFKPGPTGTNVMDIVIGAY